MHNTLQMEQMVAVSWMRFGKVDVTLQFVCLLADSKAVTTSHKVSTNNYYYYLKWNYSFFFTFLIYFGLQPFGRPEETVSEIHKDETIMCPFGQIASKLQKLC